MTTASLTALSPTHHLPDVLDCLANLSSDEVFTPPVLVNAMLDALPPEVWSNPSLKFLDPAVKSGVFLRECAKRLMEGLQEAFANEDERREHILKNMLYGIAITELTSLMARRTLYCSKTANSPHSLVTFATPEGNIAFDTTVEHTFEQGKCIYCNAPETRYDRASQGLENYAYPFIHQFETLECFEPMQFDVILGNPPYQLSDGGHGASASPIYHKFVEQAKAMNPKYISFIIPSRWFAGGKGLDEFRHTMLNDDRLKVMVDHPNSNDCFPGVEIKGGVCYFLWQRDYHGDCTIKTMQEGACISEAIRPLNEYDVFIRYNEAVSILKKVQAFNEPTLDTQVSSLKPFGFRTFFKDFEPLEAHSTPPPDNCSSLSEWVKIYARGQQGWVERSKITINPQWIDRWKVLSPRAAVGDGNLPNAVLAKPIIAEPNSCCTETYLVCGVFSTQAEATHFAQFLRTRFARFLVFLRKNTQDTNKDKFAFVPQLPMATAWCDATLYQRYGFTPQEVAFIERMIKEMP